MTPTTRSVTPDETSQEQLRNMLSEDSALMRDAAASGRRTAHKRGMINGTMAAEASQGAMVREARDFALNDANTYAKTASENMSAENSAAQFNATETNRFSLQEMSMNHDQLMRELIGSQANALSAIENGWKEKIQTNATYASIMGNTQQALAQIMSNDKLGPKALEAAIDTLLASSKAQMVGLDKLSGVDLSAYAIPQDAPPPDLSAIQANLHKLLGPGGSRRT